MTLTLKSSKSTKSKAILLLFFYLCIGYSGKPVSKNVVTFDVQVYAFYQFCRQSLQGSFPNMRRVQTFYSRSFMFISFQIEQFGDNRSGEYLDQCWWWSVFREIIWLPNISFWNLNHSKKRGNWLHFTDGNAVMIFKHTWHAIKQSLSISSTYMSVCI